jgi:hypothetical protein
MNENKPRHVGGVAVTLHVLYMGDSWFKSWLVALCSMGFPWVFFGPYVNAVIVHVLGHNCFFPDHFELIIHDLVCIQRCRGRRSHKKERNPGPCDVGRYYIITNPYVITDYRFSM